MTPELDGLLRLLHLDEVGSDVFRGPVSTEEHTRAFGGQLVAQALMAATATVEPARRAHSLHATFLRPAHPSTPVDYGVERTRDGRSFSARSVDAHQRDQLIFRLTASFHQDEVGYEHAGAMPAVAAPEDLPAFDERFAGRESTDMVRWFTRAQAFDIRYAGTTPFDPPSPSADARQQVWFRAHGGLADDPGLHFGVIAYASDMTALDAILLRHGMRWTDRPIMGASLDHSMWFHAPFRADEWLLFDQVSPVAHGARGFARGELWARDGRLVASFAQEALLRPPGERHPA